MIRVVEKILIVLTAIVVLLATFLMPPFNKVLISMTVMHFYSASCAEEALPASEGIELNIPGGGESEAHDWFPFVMTFHPGETFGSYIGQNTSLSILYNFGDFDPQAGCSSLYDPQSPYYSSFYGAYLVKNENGSPYGFVHTSDGKIAGIEQKDVAAVARFDYQKLVLREFGLTRKNAVFDFTVDSILENVDYAGSGGWYRIDARLTVNGCGHKKTEFVRSYMQYGIPAYDVEEDLAPVGMYGRMYGKFIEEKGVSVFFYIIAADMTVLEETDREILGKSTLTISSREARI